MKRRLIYGIMLAIALCFGLTSGALAQEKGETVEVCLPSFAVSFNGTEIDTSDAQYPIIVYNDMTYLPIETMYTTEYNYMSALGFIGAEEISSSFYRKCFVRNLWFEKSIPEKVEFLSKDAAIEREMTAQVSEKSDIIINCFGDVREVYAKDYPILIFAGREYLPMTYEISHNRLGLGYSFTSDGGLELSRARIPQRIVSVPSFGVTLNGVRYQNERARYPFFLYNDIVYMPLTEGIADFMGIKFIHYDASDAFNECVVFGNKLIRNDNADFGYVADGDSFAFELCEPYDGEMYINGFGTKWHTFGVEYPPMKLGNVYYFPLTWQIAHDFLGWEYSFDAKNGLMLDSRNTFMPEFSFDVLPMMPEYNREYYPRSGDYYVGYKVYTKNYDDSFGSNILKIGKRGMTEKVIDISDIIEKYNIMLLHPKTGAVPQPEVYGKYFIAHWAGYRFVFDLDECVLSEVTESEF